MKIYFIIFLFLLQQINSFSQNVVDLRIFINQPAYLYIDGARIGLAEEHSNDPYIVASLVVGTHKIKAVPVNNGFETYESTFSLKYGYPNTLEIILKKISTDGTLTLDISNIFVHIIFNSCFCCT